MTANHLAIADDYLNDLRASVDEVRKDPTLARSGSAPMYGMMAKVPMRGLVESSVRKLMESMYAPGVIVPDVTKAGAGDGVVGKLMDKFGPRVNELLDKASSLKERFGRRGR